MLITSKKLLSALLTFTILFSYSGLIVPLCPCCNGYTKSSEEAIGNCCGHETMDYVQNGCHNEKNKEPKKQINCNCPGDCECRFLCNMPDHTNAVTTTIQHFPERLLKLLILQPVIHTIEYFSFSFIHLRPDIAKINPLKLPLTIPLRI